jgi:hypothetical protein
MELAIPFLALGGMYVISNQSNRSEGVRERESKPKESYVNMGSNRNYLPNLEVPPQNFPISNINQLIDTTQEYPNPNAATDKYFNQDMYEKKVRGGVPVTDTIQNVYSLTGDYLKTDQFKHNNMVPFYGGKPKGHTYHVNTTESILDNMMGSGSQTIKKLEQAPLFKPEQNMQWTYGAPNNSDFYQSRVNPGMKANNVKPFETVMVGPGLDKEYGVNGSGGFNSGMEARDKWLPYTVDQLRTVTNPKLEYELTDHEGPANAFNKNTPMKELLGRIEKNRPDTFFLNSQDRWFTTTGASKGETLRPIQEMGIIRKNDREVDYAGPAGPTDVKAGYAPENFETSKRVQLPCLDIKPSTAVGRGPSTDTDNNLRSHSNYANHRNTTKQPDTMRSGFGGAIGAVIAPLFDAFRPTRKDETINSLRVYGEVKSAVPGNYVLNMNDTTKVTNKETTIYSPEFHINNQGNSLYVNNYSNPDLTQRDTTSCEYYTAAGGYATAYGDMTYDAAYNQHNNTLKPATAINPHNNQGGTNIFNQQMNVTTIRDDTDRFAGWVGAPSSVTPAPPNVNTYGAIRSPQYYDQCFGCLRIEPSILDAYRANPFTHSLTNSV